MPVEGGRVVGLLGLLQFAAFDNRLEALALRAARRL